MGSLVFSIVCLGNTNDLGLEEEGMDTGLDTLGRSIRKES